MPPSKILCIFGIICLIQGIPTLLLFVYVDTLEDCGQGGKNHQHPCFDQGSHMMAEG